VKKQNCYDENKRKIENAGTTYDIANKLKRKILNLLNNISIFEITQFFK